MGTITNITAAPIAVRKKFLKFFPKCFADTKYLEWERNLRQDLADLQPRDYIDLQSFIWVCGSAEYDE